MLHNQLISFTKPLIICLALLECFLCQNRCSIRGNILLHPLLGGNCLFIIAHPGGHILIPDNIKHVFLGTRNHRIGICISFLPMVAVIFTVPAFSPSAFHPHLPIPHCYLNFSRRVPQKHSIRQWIGSLHIQFTIPCLYL